MPPSMSASTSTVPPRLVKVTDGRRPTNDHRPQRSACSTDSNRKPGSSPTMRRNAATGVVRSARTSRQTGTTVWSRASARNSSRLGRSTECAMEAAVIAGVAGAAALLLHHEQERVAVAVVPGLAEPLAVAGGGSLDPDLLAGPAPVGHLTGLERAAQRVGVHVGDLEDVAAPVLLHDR